jgi:hypothetical protein
MNKDEEYHKKYLNCMYRAKKLIVERYANEYREILNELLLEQGVVPRSMRAELLKIYKKEDQNV